MTPPIRLERREGLRAKRDLLQPLATAVRARGIRFGTYYSQSQDWVNRGGGKGNTPPWDEEQKMGSFDEYLATIALPQVREILEKYHPDILWWDTEYQMTPERAKPFFDLACSIQICSSTAGWAAACSAIFELRNSRYRLARCWGGRSKST